MSNQNDSKTPNYAKVRGRWLVQTGKVKYVGGGIWVVDVYDKKYVVTEEDGCTMCDESKPCSHEYAAEYLGKTF